MISISRFLKELRHRSNGTLPRELLLTNCLNWWFSNFTWRHQRHLGTGNNTECWASAQSSDLGGQVGPGKRLSNKFPGALLLLLLVGATL